EETCDAPNHPQKPALGRRALPFSRELWIERQDFMEQPAPGFHRLFPGNRVRLRYAYVVTCTGCEKDGEGNVIAVHCEYDPETRSGTPGAEKVKVKGNIHWLSARHARRAEVRLYDRLFRVPQPGTERSFIEDLNPDSRKLAAAQIEPLLAAAPSEARYQFERHGYFVADLRDARPERPVFNRAVSLRDSWAPARR
ncbi:MAG TPA: glutamine--tRNA ligase, partial [Burkholderiales bacterium]|nr:glutamine--tRNA ligase [Burkholderiales bacterium]